MRGAPCVAAQQKEERDFTVFEKRKAQPIYGIVDAGIWLTVIDGARQADVALITDNRSDLADLSDPSRPHELLANELEAAGSN